MIQFNEKTLLKKQKLFVILSREQYSLQSLKHTFARLIFSFKKFQEMGTKSILLNFQNSFSASYFSISQESIDQNSSLTPLLE